MRERNGRVEAPWLGSAMDTRPLERRQVFRCRAQESLLRRRLFVKFWHGFCRQPKVSLMKQFTNHFENVTR